MIFGTTDMEAQILEGVFEPEPGTELFAGLSLVVTPDRDDTFLLLCYICERDSRQPVVEVSIPVSTRPHPEPGRFDPVDVATGFGACVARKLAAGGLGAASACLTQARAAHPNGSRKDLFDSTVACLRSRSATIKSDIMRILRECLTGG